MKYRIAKVISYVTVVPVVAFITILLSFIYRTRCFSSTGWFVYSIIFLTIIPILAYPVHRIVPALRKGGRNSERKLALYLL